MGDGAVWPLARDEVGAQWAAQLFKAIEGAISSAFVPGSGYSAPRNDYTPLLGVALVAGIGTLIAGGVASRRIEHEREELEVQRRLRLAAVAPELSGAEIEAMVPPRRARDAAAEPPATGAMPEALTPPPDAPSEPPRKPLRPAP